MSGRVHVRVERAYPRDRMACGLRPRRFVVAVSPEEAATSNAFRINGCLRCEEAMKREGSCPQAAELGR